MTDKLTAWEALAAKELKGAAPDSLVWLQRPGTAASWALRSAQGISVKGRVE